MAYQAKKSKTFAEDLELVDEHGSVVHTLHVNLDADDMVAKLNRKYTELTKSLEEVSEIQRNAENNEKMNEAFEKLGSAVTNLFEAVFGKEDTELIIAFYEGRYIEMTKEITFYYSVRDSKVYRNQERKPEEYFKFLQQETEKEDF